MPTPRPLPEGPLHFVGIGGAGQSALATVLASRGRTVRGTDRAISAPVRARLERAGIEVRDRHDAAWVAGAAAVVASDAVADDNPELVSARELGVPVFRRPEALGSLVGSGRLIAVAGTHGKTTTTGMVSQVLLEAGSDPTVLVGGDFDFLGGGNAHLGAGAWTVVEACEAYGGLEWLRPDVAVVTSLDPDHLDFHGSAEAMRDTFLRFVGRVPVGGCVVWCADDPVARERVPPAIPAGVRSVPYGIGEEGREWSAAGICVGPDETLFRAVDARGVALGVRLKVPGLHNVANALAAVAVGRAVAVPDSGIVAGLRAFGGAARRFERLGVRDGVLVVDDYAHHPNEIRAAIAAARAAYPDRRVVAVFQPHLPSRTRDFFDDFAAALSEADRVYLLPIYLAREVALPDVTSAALAGKITGPSAVSATDFASLATALRRETAPGDLLLVMGAGDVRIVGEQFLSASGDRL